MAAAWPRGSRARRDGGLRGPVGEAAEGGRGLKDASRAGRGPGSCGVQGGGPKRRGSAAAHWQWGGGCFSSPLGCAAQQFGVAWRSEGQDAYNGASRHVRYGWATSLEGGASSRETPSACGPNSAARAPTVQWADFVDIVDRESVGNASADLDSFDLEL